MKRFFQKLTIGIVLRVVHAALVELYCLDSRVRQELDHLREGMCYSIRTGHGAPVLHVAWENGKLRRKSQPNAEACTLNIKSVPLAFQLFTGQMGLAQSYARHAFTMSGDIADVMKLARLVNIVEAYLFPKFITRHILTDIPALQVCFLRVYGRIALGFLTSRYKLR